MNIDIWSDVVCPWCYIGKRRFEAAAARFEHRDALQVRWHSFELDPSAAREATGEPAQRLAAKYGVTEAHARQLNDQLTELAAADGLEFHLERTRSGNTFDAHRLLQLAAEAGVQDQLQERLHRGYFTEGLPIGDPGVLGQLAAEAGVPAGEASRVLAGADFADAVRADEATAAQLGITGVPFFVIDGRYGISGAQPAEAILEVLDRAWPESHHPARASQGS